MKFTNILVRNLHWGLKKKNFFFQNKSFGFFIFYYNFDNKKCKTQIFLRKMK